MHLIEDVADYLKELSKVIDPLSTFDLEIKEKCLAGLCHLQNSENELLSLLVSNIRCSHQRSSLKVGVLKNLAKFKRKHLCQSLWHGCFLVNFEKFLRTHFLQSTSGRLLLEYPSNLLCIIVYVFKILF